LPARSQQEQGPGFVRYGRNGKTPHDSVSHIQLYQANHLGGCLVELLGCAAVTIPIQYQMCTEDAATRDRRDVSNLRKNPGVPQESDDPKVVKRRSKAAS
jgi:hypothetical protein